MVRILQFLRILRSYRSDGAPVSSRVFHKLSSLPSPSTTTRRECKGSQEFFVQTCFYRFSDHHANAKSVVFACYPKLQSQLEGHGPPMHCVIEHHVEDRACFSALDPLHERHRMVSVSKLMNWQVRTPCAAQDLHNGLKWSMHARFHNLGL